MSIEDGAPITPRLLDDRWDLLAHVVRKRPDLVENLDLRLREAIRDPSALSSLRVEESELAAHLAALGLAEIIFRASGTGRR